MSLKPTILVLLLVLLSANTVSTTLTYSSEEEGFVESLEKEENADIYRDAGVLELDLPEYDDWKSLEFSIKVVDGPGTYVHLDGSFLNRFFLETEHQTYMVLDSAHPFRNSYSRLEETDYDLEEGWYRVNLEKTGNWTGTMKVEDLETGEEEKNMEGNKIKDDYIFNVFYDKPGSFTPSTLYLYQGTGGKRFRNVSFTFEKEVDPAPDNSKILVEPSPEKALLASTTKQDFTVTEKIDRDEKHLENYTEVYTLGDVDTGEIETTEIKKEDVLPVFFPEKEEYIRLGENRSENLFRARYAMEKGLPVSYKEEDLEQKQPDRNEIQGFIRNESGGHAVIVDSSSESSVLSPVYSKKVDASMLVLDSDETLNADRKFREKLKSWYRDESTEPSPERLVEGLYVTNFGAPMKEIEDPIEAERNVLYSDEIDNETIYTDSHLTDLDSDGFADVNYGRLPEDIEKAQDILKTEKNGDKSALVAAQYMHETKPGVVANLGGGLTYGLNNMIELENQRIDTELLVENRTSYQDIGDATRGLITSLKDVPDPVKIKEDFEQLYVYAKQGRFQEVFRKVVEDPGRVAKIVEKTVGVLEGEDGFIDEGLSDNLPLTEMAGAVKTADRGAELLMTGLEYRPDYDQEKFGEFVEALEENRGYRKVEEKFLDSFIAPREPLKGKNLGNISEKSKAIYIGEGNGTHWHLPDGDFRPAGFDGFLIDTSPIAGRPGSELLEKTLENGSKGFLGFTGNTYYHYTQELVQRFLRRGYRTGSAYRKSLNSYKRDSWTFDPENAAFLNAYWRSRARKNKTLKSFLHYGLPETVKDPVAEIPPEPEKKCVEGFCRYSWTEEVEHSFKENFLVFEDVETFKEPEMPEVFFKKFSRTFPADARIKEIDLVREEKVLDINYVENVTETVFPADDKQLENQSFPDGRKELTVKVPVLRNYRGETRVTEKIDLNIETEQNTSLSVDAGRESVSVNLNVSEKQGGKVVLTQGNRTDRKKKVREVEPRKGRNSLVFESLEGFDRYDAEAYFIGENVLGPVKDSYEPKNKDQRELDVKAGEEFEIRVPGDLDERPELSTSEGVQTGFLENSTPSANENLVFTGIAPGKQKVELETENRKKVVHVRVEGAETSRYREKSNGSYLEKQTRFDRFIHNSSKDTEVFSYSNDDGKLDIVKNHSEIRMELSMPDLKAEKIWRSGEKTEKIFEPGGYLVRNFENGEKTSIGQGIDESVLDLYMELMEEEMDKLMERKDVLRSGS